MATDWRARDFHAGNAYFLGQAAQLAYKNKAVVANTVQKWGMELVQFFNIKETQAFLAQNDETYILAFRGTEPAKLKDWMTDADTQLVNGPGGKVHDGFYCALNYIWRDLWKIIDTQRGFRSLWVTGHSLGGALAALAVAKIRLERAHPVNGLYTFGQPRVGDEQFVNNFNQDFGTNTFRFVNYRDVVPRIPLRSMSYRDTNTFQYFNEQQYIPEAPWGEQLLRRVGNSIDEILQKADIVDHYMDNYLLKLKALANPDVLHQQ